MDTLSVLTRTRKEVYQYCIKMLKDRTTFNKEKLSRRKTKQNQISIKTPKGYPCIMLTIKEDKSRRSRRTHDAQAAVFRGSVTLF